MSASFCLRARWNVDEAVVADAVCGARRWRAAPPSWSWSWPLDESGSLSMVRPARGTLNSGDPSFAVDNAALTPNAASHESSASDVSWLRDVRAVAVSDNGNSIVFVSKKGKVILATWNGVVRLTDLHVDISVFRNKSSAGAAASDADIVPSGGEADIYSFASSVTCFQVRCPGAIQAVDVVAVGYDSGALVLFDLATGIPCSATRPVAGQPVRRLRFVPMFHLLDPVATFPENAQYPYPTNNAGLFCVFGWSGVLGRLPMSALYEAITARRNDIRSANWTLWRANEQDIVFDATPSSSEPSSICEMDALPNQGPLRIVAAGYNPPIAAFACGDIPAFSARDAARMAAAAVWRVAGSALYSRFMPGTRTSVSQEPESEEKDDGKAMNASLRMSLTWDDSYDPAQKEGFGFQNVKESARQSLTGVLRRRQAIGMATDVDLRSNMEKRGGGLNVSENYSSSLSLRNIGPGSRIIQHCVSAPLPCSLFASCDSLGRILIMDARDLCVLHVLKGYRDARVAWLACGGPALVALAPRRSLLEIHDPVLSLRLAAFRIETGSLLIQSATFGVFLFTPKGCLYELVRTKKWLVPEDSVRVEEFGVCHASPVEINGDKDGDKYHVKEQATCLTAVTEPPPAETIASFITFCRTGQAGSAVEIMDEVAVGGMYSLAHLMAALVCTSAVVRSEVHVAVAAEAARLAKNTQNTDLELRFEAHGRLGEAFGLLASVVLPTYSSLATLPCPSRGPRLLEDEILSNLLLSYLEEEPQSGNEARTWSKRSETEKKCHANGTLDDTSDDDSGFCCEDFILAHVILPPDSDAALLQGYILRPRDDLSALERVRLSRSYFTRLLAFEEYDLTRGSSPEPSSCLDIFRALKHVLGYGVDRIASHFLDFFLWTSLEQLLKTHVALRYSGLRCALNRLRSGVNKVLVDDMIIETCENSIRIANALLLVRLCVVQEDRAKHDGVDERYLCLMEKLRQAVSLQTYLVGSRAESAVRGRITASHFQGNPAEAERQAVSLLGESGESARAAAVVAGMSIKQPQAEWHEMASVSEVALQVSRHRVARLLDPSAHCELPPKLSKWIREGLKGSDTETIGPPESADDVMMRVCELQGIQVLLTAAHEHFPDTSIDAVRCSQLQEGINLLLRRFNQEVTGEPRGVTEQVVPVVSLDGDHDQSSPSSNTTR
jgi:Rab3 GTPase-activating protein regulatory subunit N-terminus